MTRDSLVGGASFRVCSGSAGRSAPCRLTTAFSTEPAQAAGAGASPAQFFAGASGGSVGSEAALDFEAPLGLPARIGSGLAASPAPGAAVVRASLPDGGAEVGQASWPVRGRAPEASSPPGRAVGQASRPVQSSPPGRAAATSELDSPCGRATEAGTRPAALRAFAVPVRRPLPVSPVASRGPADGAPPSSGAVSGAGSIRGAKKARKRGWGAVGAGAALLAATLAVKTAAAASAPLAEAIAREARAGTAGVSASGRPTPQPSLSMDCEAARDKMRASARGVRQTIGAPRMAPYLTYRLSAARFGAFTRTAPLGCRRASVSSAWTR
jgi:hypothetical protein